MSSKEPLSGNKTYVKKMLQPRGIALESLKLDKSIDGGGWRYSFIYDLQKERSAFGEGMEPRERAKADLLAELLEEHFQSYNVDVEITKVHNLKVGTNYRWRVEATIYFIPA